MTDDCPAREQLEGLLQERLAEAERRQVERHVQGCPSCQQALDRLLDADRQQCLPGHMPSSLERPDHAPGGAEALARVKQTPLADADAAERVSQVVFQFPGPPTPRGPLGQLRSYHMIELLGAGAAGYVFKAYDQDLDRLVAIKVLRPELAVVAGSRARFVREARAAAAMQHEHVVAIHSVESHPDFPLPYIVMEYVAGETLAARLQREAALPVNEAVAIVRQVAIGLSAAHDQGLVHRDIKPSNILLQTTDQTDHTDTQNRHPSTPPSSVPSVTSVVCSTAKITDFGLARAVEAADQGGKQRLTRSGHILGTPAYMSPEHILAPEKVNAQSDVYSLGVVLYELLTGQLPFPGTTHQVLMQVVHGDPVAPRLRNEHVPPALSDITMTCLAKEPGRRYLSARELAVELERWRAGETVHARPLGLAGKLARWCRRNPALASAWTVAGLLCLALIVLGGLLARWHHQADVRLQAEREQTNRAQQESQRLAALRALDRGLALCGQGQTDQGLLWLARALELAPVDADDLQWSIRTQLAAWSRSAIALKEVFPHQGLVRTVAFSPDGRMVLTHSVGTDSWQWDIASGKRVNAPETSTLRVSAAVFSPDGQTVLAGFPDGKFAIFDVRTGKYRRRDLGHTGEIRALAFSADGTRYLTGSRDRTAQMWKTGTGEPEPLGPPLQHPHTVEAVAFSPDGRMLFTGCFDHQARLWDANSGMPLGSPLVHQGHVTSVAFSPDGRILLTASKDHTARLWDAASGKPIGPPMLHKDKVYAAVFSADGRWIATGSNDCTAQLWDARTGRAIGAPLVHDGPVYAVAFSPDGRWLATGGEDATARLWRLPDNPTVDHLVIEEGKTIALAFSPDGRTVAVAVDFPVPSGTQFAVKRYDARSWEPIGEPLRQNGIVRAVKFSRDGQLLLTAGDDRTARLWNAATGEPVGPPIQINHAVLSVAFSPDGKIVLTGDEDKRIRLWDANTFAALRQPLIHQAAVCALAFSPDGRLILSGSWDKTAQLWDAESGTPRGSPLRHHGPVMAVAFSPEGKSFVTGSRDSTTQVWDTATGTPRGAPFIHERAVVTVGISPDGRLVATGSEDRTARFWDVATGCAVGPPLAHREGVLAVAFRPDGRVLASAGEEALVRLWPVPAPVKGDVERTQLWVQVSTGLELEAEGRIRRLPADTWQQRRQHLEELGGPPMR